MRFCDLTNRTRSPDRSMKIAAPFFEVVTNPQLEVADISMLSAVAREKCSVDCRYNRDPFFGLQCGKFGVTSSGLQHQIFLEGDQYRGLIIDYATFDWRNNKVLNQLANEQESMHLTPGCAGRFTGILVHIWIRELPKCRRSALKPSSYGMRDRAVPPLNWQPALSRPKASSRSTIPDCLAIRFTGESPPVRRCSGAMLTFDLLEGCLLSLA